MVASQIENCRNSLGQSASIQTADSAYRHMQTGTCRREDSSCEGKVAYLTSSCNELQRVGVDGREVATLVLCVEQS